MAKKDYNQYIPAINEIMDGIVCYGKETSRLMDTLGITSISYEDKRVNILAKGKRTEIEAKISIQCAKDKYSVSYCIKPTEDFLAIERNYKEFASLDKAANYTRFVLSSTISDFFDGYFKMEGIKKAAFNFYKKKGAPSEKKINYELNKRYEIAEILLEYITTRYQHLYKNEVL